MKRPRFYLLIVSCFLSVFALYAGAAPIFKTIDESGNPVFSDTGSESSVEVELEDTSIIAFEKYNEGINARLEEFEDERKPVKKFQYTWLSINSHSDGDVIRSNDGDFTLGGWISPEVQEGHMVQFMMDGKPYLPIATPTSFTDWSVGAINIPRGLHEFYLRVVSTTDREEIIQTSPKISITVKRYSQKR